MEDKENIPADYLPILPMEKWNQSTYLLIPIDPQLSPSMQTLKTAQVVGARWLRIIPAPCTRCFTYHPLVPLLDWIATMLLVHRLLSLTRSCCTTDNERTVHNMVPSSSTPLSFGFTKRAFFCICRGAFTIIHIVDYAAAQWSAFVFCIEWIWSRRRLGRGRQDAKKGGSKRWMLRIRANM